MPLRLFFSYSHKDEQLRDQLAAHLSVLQHLNLILPWHDRRIGAGDDWSHEIDERLRTAEIVLLLISPDFLASSYCFDIEMKLALERHAAHQAIVIPVILRPCDWAGAPFAHLQALPRDARAITLWTNQDEAFAAVVQSIRETVLRFQQPPAAPQPPLLLSELFGAPQTVPRMLDAAMPGHIVKDRATELSVLIRLPNSRGLQGVLEEDDEAEARPEDVRSKPFDVAFPFGPTGRPEPLNVTIELASPDFAPPQQTKHVIVPVNADSEVCSFLLTPLRYGLLTVVIELVWQDAARGNRRLRATCVSEADPASVAMRVVQMPLAVASAIASPQVAAAAAPASSYAPRDWQASPSPSAFPLPPPPTRQGTVPVATPSGAPYPMRPSGSQPQPPPQSTSRRSSMPLLLIAILAILLAIFAAAFLFTPK